MEAQPKPLLKYAEELQRSYSRLIVYSGDILRSLPEPREGLSVANIKPKKDESTAFLREWQHLESVFDEYLIRLNDIRTRAHEELEAARIKCLAGQEIDLTLPEAVVILSARLAKYKQQYDTLQKIISGESVAEELEERKDDDDEAKGSEPTPAKHMEVDGSTPDNNGIANFTGAEELGVAATHAREDILVDTPPTWLPDSTYSQDAHDENILNVDTPDNLAMDESTQTPMSVQNTYDAVEIDEEDDEDFDDVAIDNTEVMEVATSATPDAEVIDVDDMQFADQDNNNNNDSNGIAEAIEPDSVSDVDDEDMEDIFQ
ncbi:hypothetical protein GGI07_000155 [Coemansia sp. Benny D115]|nr:hypothetical protein GGI07_000155 [Coemansia sp. Benny D115]